MADMTTKYMGLDLKNPIIVGSSGLTESIEKVEACAKAGAGAVVLKSIFEEQILHEVGRLAKASDVSYWHTEAADYINQYGREHAVDAYVRLMREAKERVTIPVIASIHCVSAGGWTEFAKRAEDVGVDALELNVYVTPADKRLNARDNEQLYIDIVKAVKKAASIPVALKIGRHFSSLPEMATELGYAGVDALVLFNRYRRIDFDIEKLALVPGNLLSTPDEMTVPLRWVSLLSGDVDYDIAATTGVHDGKGVVKQLLAGAKAVQVCSVLYQRGVGHVRAMLAEVEDWMKRHGYASIDEFRGKLSQEASKNPAEYERLQFMKASLGKL
jgi:dihydroorotate dehydrogenase (fumarate)